MRVVVVTGGGTGIGAACAQRFADDGAQVVVLGRRRAPLEEVAVRTGAHAVVADAADGPSARAAVAEVLARFGRLDVLVANAGGHGTGTVGDTDDAAWAAAMTANLTSAFVVVREALPALVEARGSVVLVSSLAGLFAGPGVAGYTVAKHALLGLTRSVARDYGRHGVRANAVCPGWVRTPMAHAEMAGLAARGTGLDEGSGAGEAPAVAGSDEASEAAVAAGYARVTRDVPLRRPAEPAEIAGVVAFLASPDASYVTGSVLVADGGAHAVDLPTTAFDDGWA